MKLKKKHLRNTTFYTYYHPNNKGSLAFNRLTLSENNYELAEADLRVLKRTLATVAKYYGGVKCIHIHSRINDNGKRVGYAIPQPKSTVEIIGRDNRITLNLLPNHDDIVRIAKAYVRDTDNNTILQVSSYDYKASAWTPSLSGSK